MTNEEKREWIDAIGSVIWAFILGGASCLGFLAAAALLQAVIG